MTGAIHSDVGCVNRVGNSESPMEIVLKQMRRLKGIHHQYISPHDEGDELSCSRLPHGNGVSAQLTIISTIYSYQPASVTSRTGWSLPFCLRCFDVLLLHRFVQMTVKKAALGRPSYREI